MGRSIEGTGILVHTILPVTFIHHSLLFFPQLPIRFYVCFFLAFCCTCAFSVWHSIYFLHLINSLSLFFSPSHSFPLYYSHPLYTALNLPFLLSYNPFPLTLYLSSLLPPHWFQVPLPPPPPPLRPRRLSDQEVPGQDGSEEPMEVDNNDTSNCSTYM